MSNATIGIAVVIPCYRVASHILDVLAAIGPEVDAIYVVDDACPQASGELVRTSSTDPRVRVLRHEQNQGVGGAMVTGYRAALADGMGIVVKLDGDGQMDPRLIPRFTAPLLAGEADYTKGNRFYDLRYIGRMPGIRLLGNAALSFFNKFSTGYWDIFDPTNGYTAVTGKILGLLPLERLSKRYFFESDMLFRLGTFRAVVCDVPMDAIYGDEVSNLRVSKVLPEFLAKHLRNSAKRIFYCYFLRDVSIASLELLAGTVLATFGLLFGVWHWWLSVTTSTPASSGTVMLAALTVLMGMQLLLGKV